jgi:hypothetical protein
MGVINLRCLAIIPPRAFIALWCDYHKKGFTLRRLASRLGRKVQSVKLRGDTMMQKGVVLPPLELGEEPNIQEIIQRELTQLDIAEGWYPEKLQCTL